MLSYKAPRATLQQVLQKHGWPSTKNAHVEKVLQRIKVCRTAALGYHMYQCRNDECGHVKYQYHSCRDRHCPNCGAVKKQQWIEARTQELLPVKYYHVVFTLPHELNPVMMGHRKLLFKLLFDAAAQTLLCFAKDPQYLGAMPGIISVLHTWGQQLSFHPHVHCIVSGGGIINNNEWKSGIKNCYRFLFPVKAMQVMYRAKFLAGLKQLIAVGEVTLPPADEQDTKHWWNLLYKKNWVVYAKAPFGGPHGVIEYLGSYTHKVAISNHRITSINDDGSITFNYKDYADNNAKKQMTLTCSEFTRRFEQHILPSRFTKIRTYGYLANRDRHHRINEVLRRMKLPLHPGIVKIPLMLYMQEKYGIDINECPCCKSKTLELVAIFYPWKQTDDG